MAYIKYDEKLKVNILVVSLHRNRPNPFMERQRQPAGLGGSAG